MLKSTSFQRFLACVLAIAPALIAQNQLLVLSSADGSSMVSPGSLATAYSGSFDAPPVTGQPDEFGEFPTELGGYSVDVNGSRAHLLSVSGSRINFILPADIQPGEARITLTTSQMIARGAVTVRPVAPSIFTMVVDRREVGAILNAVTFRGGPFAMETPEIPGCDNRTRLALFATGIGLAARHVRARDVHVEAQDATGAVYDLDVDAVPAPGLPSVEQLNVTLVSGMLAGTIQLRVIANGVASNRVQTDLAPREGAAPTGACLGRVDIARASDGSGFSGAVSLAWPAPAGGVMLQLTADDPSIQLPASVAIAEGTYSATFPVTIAGAQAPKKFHVTAAIGGDARPGSIGSTVTRIGSFEEGPACVDGVSLAVAGIPSGNNLSGRITLTDPAPLEGAEVSLLTDHSSVSVGPKIMVPPGQTSVAFAISTALTVSPGRATIIATGGCGGSSAMLTLW